MKMLKITILLCLCMQTIVSAEDLETRTTFYDNKSPKELSTFKLDSDGFELREGLSTSWYENGQKESECFCKDGIPEGLSSTWYENGQKKSEDRFVAGVPEGISTEWYENGQKKSEKSYCSGTITGIFTEWYENGQKETEGIFRAGKVSIQMWNKDGTPKK